MFFQSRKCCIQKDRPNKRCVLLIEQSLILAIVHRMSAVLEEEQTSKAACSQAVRQSVFEVLTCPICHEYMIPPITVCQGGHNICRKCRPTLQIKGGSKCPRCRKALLDTRNVALETIARGLKYPCRYNGIGCKEKYNMDDIGKHHARCAFRSYDCPIRELEHCAWNGK